MAAMQNHYIPEDLVMNILPRLPVKSLKRFSSVCKSWFNLFKDPNFVAKHHQDQTNPSVLVQHHSERHDKDFCFSILSYSDGGNEKLTLTESDCIPFVEGFRYIPKVIGTCNGLICIEDDGETIVLWNPATREFKPLPSPQINRPYDADSYWYRCHGFGFDPNTNDYKVLRFVTNGFPGDEFMYQIELYSLNNDSWREIFYDYDSLDLVINFFDTSSNGVCYWWACREGTGLLIMSFDFATETFEEFSKPNFETSRSDNHRRLGFGPVLWIDHYPALYIFNGLLATIYSPKAPTKWFDIWVMTEHGRNGSWVKQFRIGPILGIERVLGFCKNGGMFLEDSNKQLVLYDPDTEELKNLKLHGALQRKRSGLQVVNYVESLVPIHRVRGDI